MSDVSVNLYKAFWSLRHTLMPIQFVISVHSHLHESVELGDSIQFITRDIANPSDAGRA